ncbi:MAG: hypothetical protein GX446_10280 [Chthonomonadales bacterium]|nr:hypothetical protein [Chthonomonadales bacterium]
MHTVTHILRDVCVWTALIAGLAVACVARSSSVVEPEVLARIAHPRPVTIRRHDLTAGITEPRAGRRFAAAVRVEAERAGAQETRFVVYAPDDTMRPLATRVARFLGLLWAYADTRFRVLSPRLRSGVASVWLCRDGSGGAEQSRDAIHIYEASADRSDLEWARTLAHEYGHYLLPGPSGYAEPEPWSNGILGERLFLGWLRDDIRAGVLPASDSVYLTADTANEYHAKQVEPLVERIARRGVDRALIDDRGRRGMDEAIALLLYAARLHGTNALADMLDWLPTRTGRQATGSDYLSAYEAWLGGSDLFRHGSLAPTGDPTGTARESYRAYIPSGSWRVQVCGRRLVSVEGCVVKPADDGWLVQARASAWRRVELDGPPVTGEQIVWTKDRSR